MKYRLQLKVASTQRLGMYTYLRLECPGTDALPQMLPGQFVEVRVDRCDALLNRPFSIFHNDAESLGLLIKPLGKGSKALAQYLAGDTLTVIAPLGRGFTLTPQGGVLLVAGGVGVAPMYALAQELCHRGVRPTLLYGERHSPDPSLINMLGEYADIHICTDDGSEGFHGFVSQHPLLQNDYSAVKVCGPLPMMKSMYRICRQKGWNTEFSLENKMACGLGACLCCVENTAGGNRCVCTDGPVFNINELVW